MKTSMAEGVPYANRIIIAARLPANSAIKMTELKIVLGGLNKPREYLESVLRPRTKAKVLSSACSKKSSATLQQDVPKAQPPYPPK
jgi:hypothetical protein